MENEVNSVPGAASAGFMKDTPQQTQARATNSRVPQTRDTSVSEVTEGLI